MKFIIKQDEPSAMIDWKNLANDEWHPTWAALQNPEKNILKESLVKEQGFLCCYCQQRIEVNRHTEIEHIITREECDRRGNEALKLEYTNLIASCEGNKPPSRNLEISQYRHCNGFRSNNLLPITPLQADCESYFFYDFDGNIYAKDDDVDANTTIRNLNLSILSSIRKAKINGVIPFDLMSSITNDELQELIHFYNTKMDIDHDENLKYPEFSSVIINILSQISTL
jgi:uncharacterized protein (TIGR02646 family)